MDRTPHRIPPPGTPADYDTFRLKGFMRWASCEEVECGAFTKGWHSTVQAGSDEEDLLKAACRGEVDGYRRAWTSALPEANGFVRYSFAPGQPCFGIAGHRTQEDREPLYVRAHGDWRAFLSPGLVYDRADQWADDLHARTTQRAHLRQTRG